MLVLEFKDGQGLGNQLWNYVALRSIAKNNYDFRLINFDNFFRERIYKFRN